MKGYRWLLAVVVVLAAPLLVEDASAAVASFANGDSITIVDVAAASPYPSALTVSGLSGQITKVTVTLRDLSHTFFEDIDVLLVGPSGQTLLLMSDVGRSNQISHVTLVFDDAAAASLPAGPIVSGTYRPTNLNDSSSAGTNDVFPVPAPGAPYGTTLSVFNGTDPNGIWRLFVRDDAVADAGSIADGWCLTITTDAPGGGSTSCIATLTVSRTGEGQVTSSPAGIDCGPTCAASFDASSLVSLTAVPAAGFVFSEWGGGACSGSGGCTVFMARDQVVSAVFLEVPPGSFALTVSTAGAGRVTSAPTGIDCGSDCTEVFVQGTVVTLTAIPSPGSVFAGWTGGGCGGTGPCVINPSASVSVTATFTPAPGTIALTVARAGTGLGTVTSSPAGIACGSDCSAAYAAGTQVTLTASGRRGSAFGGWIGGGCGGTGPCTTTLSADTSLAAVFNAPSDRPVIVVPSDDDPSLAAGTVASFTWTSVVGAAQYGFEFTGPNQAFANPGGVAPDPVSGFGGAGGGFVAPGTNLDVAVPPGTPAGAYQVRVVGLSPAFALVGRFSEAVTLLIGGFPGSQPTLTAPGDGVVVSRGSFVTFSWTAVPGAVQYLFAFAGGPDPGGRGGGFVLAGTRLDATVPLDVPLGAYRIRVLGLSGAGAPIGQFSDSLIITIQQ